MKEILSLLNYMKTHNKDNLTLFDLKELSNHLGLDEDETVKILNEAKKLGYIKFRGITIGETTYYITQIGINKTNEYKTTIRNIFKWLIITILGVIIGFYIEIFLGAN